MSKPEGGTAFPWDSSRAAHSGMSLRDYFAASVIGQIAGFHCCDEPTDYDKYAASAYAYADAMLKAREK